MPHNHCHLHYNYALAIAAVLLSFSLQLAQCQVDDDYNPTLLPLLTQAVYGRLSNLTSTILSAPFTKNASFCIKDPEVEWDRAFNYSSNLTFLSSCIQKTNGDMSRRLCTAAEAKFYFNNFVGGGSGVLPNKNCNLTSWVPGCEPGWACSVNSTVQVSLNESEDIPSRTLDCQACCEGFFCPKGLTCMIPCPLGSYCPLATLNKATGMCDPYLYQLPPGQPNHTCGAANIWTDVARSSEVFCSAGSYCPTSIQQVSCSSGHYCRMGSIYEKRCFKLTSCHADTVYQNIHVYGIMLIAALATILLIIYNCSDQVLSTRERRHAKSREVAARSVRQKTQAHERWKSAKNAAMKHVRGFHSQLSRTFSRRKTLTSIEELRIFSQTDIEIADDLCPTTHAFILSSSEQSSAAIGGKKKEPSDLMTGIHATEDGPDICNDTTIQVEDKNVQRPLPKKKQLHSDSQIFKYAYGQLEIEKAMQQQNLTFSGVISMATNPEIRKRPIIEVSFRDLTLALKGNNKHLLRCVTGKIVPGRIAAVMGPSGAGKTTFLSALVGKTVGCKMTGSILINGKNESIRSYRKIIGFVPQDDIVHGNLTVEENLWFSARCRLSANLPKADKVLIVERVIEELGLQAVRDSLVGTVEKRGISGGQRKRVNVGLELVMEPSLLILDEPTSGLDSSSSLLLLRALRREALVGVNICMVVHQPSYTLFNMFDDLILLAKGGLTVYHGPVKRVEEYFAGLGINVPERVNPPDHFIDVLEDIVKPSTSSSISSRELPVQWMLHNGYVVPPDMQQNSAGIAILSSRVTLHNQVDSDATLEEQSFAREVWQDMRRNVELQRDIIRHNFLRSRDLSNRRTPGVLLQYKYFIGRVVKQRLREARILAVDFLILLLAGACLGSLIKATDATFGAPVYTYTIIAVSLLCTISALRSFSLDKLQYWRESASGISSLAHFLSKDTIDHLNTVIKPAVFLSMFYSFTNPRSSFSDNYVVLLCLVYCVTGIGYTLSIFLEPGPSQLCAVLLPVVLTLISTQTGDGTFVKNLANLCYPKWALEAFVVANAERYSGVWIITRCGLLMKMGYSLAGWGRCISFLILAGVVTRAIAFVGMLTFKRKH
ncbi:ABC transporter G family member 24-like isoform X1 [Rhododendron vialii]|uniref:ABC transporter G family member 24-like isoform X1 n=1 Tax=Rhododendron vialii TaxID=182163 RepID=UPI00265FF17B|nr:ABC transporter G family member 24-like isoform X1 [Rhododendron vialii]